MAGAQKVRLGRTALLLSLAAAASCSKPGPPTSAATAPVQPPTTPATSTSPESTVGSPSQQSATNDLDLHSAQPFGRDPAPVCTHPEVLSALTAIAIQKMQATGSLFPTAATPPQAFFEDQTKARLATVTVTSFDQETVLLTCEGEFTIELASESTGAMSEKASLLFPTVVSERITYQVQPLADRSDIVIRWSQAQSSDYGGLGVAIMSAWEKRQKANGEDEQANVSSAEPDVP